jgi:hypothetical protein
MILPECIHKVKAGSNRIPATLLKRAGDLLVVSCMDRVETGMFGMDGMQAKRVSASNDAGLFSQDRNRRHGVLTNDNV